MYVWCMGETHEDMHIRAWLMSSPAKRFKQNLVRSENYGAHCRESFDDMNMADGGGNYYSCYVAKLQWKQEVFFHSNF